jgi:hypothetical protein
VLPHPVKNVIEAIHNYFQHPQTITYYIECNLALTYPNPTPNGWKGSALYSSRAGMRAKIKEKWEERSRRE